MSDARSPSSPATAPRPSRIAKVALYVAVLTVVAIAIGALGATAGLLAPLIGFLVFAAAIVVGSLLSLVLGAVALVVTRARRGRPSLAGRGAAIAATAVGVLLLVVLVALAGQSGDVPAIHDVTTDPSDPPDFVAAARAPDNQGRSLAYPHGPSDTAMLQRQAYPDLEPIHLAMPPDEAFRRARRIAEDMGWQVVEAEESEGRIEATDRSRIFRFIDDVAVRIRPAEAGGSQVDLRSTSRVGQSDLGANAARIRAFRERLVAAE